MYFSLLLILFVTFVERKHQEIEVRERCKQCACVESYINKHIIIKNTTGSLVGPIYHFNPHKIFLYTSGRIQLHCSELSILHILFKTIIFPFFINQV